MRRQDSILQHFAQNDQTIHQLLLTHGVPALGPAAAAETYFDHLCRSIIGQQLSTKVADVIAGRFRTLIAHEPAEPHRILALTDEELRSIGLSGAKTKYVKALAEAVATKLLRLDEVDAWKNEAIIEHLIQVKGIGRWTAEMFLMFTLGRPDVYSLGDLGLKTAVLNQYKIPVEKYLKFIEKQSKKWQPYRTTAAMVLWRSLDNQKK